MNTSKSQYKPLVLTRGFPILLPTCEERSTFTAYNNDKSHLKTSLKITHLKKKKIKTQMAACPSAEQSSSGCPLWLQRDSLQSRATRAMEKKQDNWIPGPGLIAVFGLSWVTEENSEGQFAGWCLESGVGLFCQEQNSAIIQSLTQDLTLILSCFSAS